MLELFRNRNFLVFWIGQFVSVVGDHVSLIAFPWLTLQLTGSPAMTGLVYAVQGLPRAVLLLAGGAVVDRTSPRAVMLVSNLLRAMLVLALAWLITMDRADITLVFIMALAFGLVDAFFYPAQNAILPSLVSKEQLQAGNAVIQMTIYLSVILGPLIAGLVIAGHVSMAGHEAGMGGSTYATDRLGLARAFGFNSIVFATSFVTLLFVRARSLKKDEAESGPSLVRDVMEALRWVWAHPSIRLGFIGVAALEFLYQAPIFVGLPVLAKQRFEEGALVYGLELAAYGTGALIGSLAGGTMKSVPERMLLRIMFWVFAYSGASLGLLVLFHPYEYAMGFFFVAGLGDSFMWVNFTTWLQRITPERMLGRVMSIFMVMAIGLLPIANAVMGLAFEINLEGSLLITSAIMVVLMVTAALHPDARRPRDRRPDPQAPNATVED
ncbi:MFS transporter [Kordiimonas marina]|uniref:MFS transporter n=1 Tax=Kordiimonas marina TaxID=2872312 RepID=UPI001FF25E9D|nr:MFS transporter [Kordiimonas marina]MCJ9428103.1 MFS transporter [Kordiimonas marina]